VSPRVHAADRRLLDLPAPRPRDTRTTVNTGPTDTAAACSTDNPHTCTRDTQLVVV
jgi:hypothetical protein